MNTKLYVRTAKSMGDDFIEKKADGKRRVLTYTPRYQMLSFIRQFNEFLAHDPAQLVRSCLTCDHFTEKTEMCELVRARPPAKIIAFACEKYENVNDDIPF